MLQKISGLALLTYALISFTGLIGAGDDAIENDASCATHVI